MYRGEDDLKGVRKYQLKRLIFGLNLFFDLKTKGQVRLQKHKMI